MDKKTEWLYMIGERHPSRLAACTQHVRDCLWIIRGALALALDKKQPQDLPFQHNTMNTLTVFYVLLVMIYNTVNTAPWLGYGRALAYGTLVAATGLGIYTLSTIALYWSKGRLEVLERAFSAQLTLSIVYQGFIIPFAFTRMVLPSLGAIGSLWGWLATLPFLAWLVMCVIKIHHHHTQTRPWLLLLWWLSPLWLMLVCLFYSAQWLHVLPDFTARPTVNLQ